LPLWLYLMRKFVPGRWLYGPNRGIYKRFVLGDGSLFELGV
jgi:hypothetical protein